MILLCPIKAILHQRTLRSQFFTSSAHSLTAGDQCVVKTANPARLEAIDCYRKVDGGNKQG